MDVLHDQVLGWWYVDIQGPSLFSTLINTPPTPPFPNVCYATTWIVFVCMLQQSQICLLFSVYLNFYQQVEELFCKKGQTVVQNLHVWGCHVWRLNKYIYILCQLLQGVCSFFFFFFRTVSEQMGIYPHVFLLPLHVYSISHTLQLSTQEYRADLICNILLVDFILNSEMNW